MDSVYLLEHVIDYGGPAENGKTIGIYTSTQEAEAAIARLTDKPGFRDHPLLFDPTAEDIASGFIIDEYLLNEECWTEGFGFEVDVCEE